MHNKPRPVPYCRVLPLSEFNDIISEPLAVYSGGFLTQAVTIFFRNIAKLENVTK